MFNKDKELYFAVVFQRVYIEELGYSIFMPTSPIIGYPIKKSQMFQDVLSGTRYINTDQAKEMDLITSFGLLTPIKTLKKNSKSKEFIRETFNILENFVYFYQQGDTEMKAMDKRAFEEENDITLSPITTEYVNVLTDQLLDGNITSKQYNEGIYGFIDSDSKKSDVVNKIIDINIQDAYNKVRARVISQDDAVKKILTCIYKTRTFKGKQKKSNILIFGPTGVGKTEIFRTLGDIFNIPVHIEDMTMYTEVGYVGSSVEDILRHVYINANEDLDLAENSIVLLDEIDKKASSERGAYDFNKGDVLKSLLKIIEGGTFEVNIGKGQSINFDTSNLTIVAAGAFSSLYEVTEKIVGFNRSNEISIKDIDIKALENYGVPIEFLGRFKTLVRMNNLTKEDFISILKNSECSALKGYKEELENLGVKFELSESIYEKIAEKAISYGTGARSLNIVVENIFEDILFDVFSNINTSFELELGNNIVEDKKNYTLKKKE